ncbi:GntR family transcriptional regulator [Photobacterium satsumensis]|uniref:GntR family transcriptional regulator n=1 Tax=Photobacterium satsumensis TaxID=2910239 RepID=UPI003D0B942C
MENNNDKDKAYNYIKKRIVKTELPPGYVLDRSVIADDLGLSITPIREALILLAHEGFIDIMPNKGTRVSYIDIDYLKEVSFMRSCLECGVVEHLSLIGLSGESLSKLRDLSDRQLELVQSGDIQDSYDLDFQFHRLLCDLTGFSSLWDTLDKYKQHLIRAINCSPLNKRAKQVAVKDHLAIIDAIEERKSNIAKNRMKKHVNRIVDELQSIPPHFIKTN